MTSSTTASKEPLRMVSRAASPSASTLTSCPSACRLKSNPWARLDSSSTTSRRATASLPFHYRGKNTRQLEADRCAVAFSGALRGGVTPVLARDGADEIQTETGALGAQDVARGHAIKAAEDALEVHRRDADSLVGDADANPGIVHDFEFDAHLHAVRRVLDGVAEDIENGGLQFVGIAAHDHGEAGVLDVERDGVLVEVVPLEG